MRRHFVNHAMLAKTGRRRNKTNDTDKPKNRSNLETAMDDSARSSFIPNLLVTSGAACVSCKWINSQIGEVRGIVWLMNFGMVLL